MTGVIRSYKKQANLTRSETVEVVAKCGKNE